MQHYQIRKAAGLYWIVKTNQLDECYVPPFPVNECGALIIQGIQQGRDKKQLIEHLMEVYGVEEREAVEAVESFLKQLGEQGMIE